MKKGSYFFWLLAYISHNSLLAIVLSPNTADAPSGSWDSIHVFEASERGRNAHYKLTSTIMLHLVTKSATAAPGSGTGKGKQEESAAGNGKGEITLSGSMTRQVRIQSLRFTTRSWYGSTEIHRSSKTNPSLIPHPISQTPVG